MSTGAEWAQSLARQARADLDTFVFLQTRASDRKTPVCHRLQFLQMACEKLTKAWLCSRAANPVDLSNSHAYVAKNLPQIVGQKLRERGIASAAAKRLSAASRHLAQEIELLAPAVKRGGQRLDNCEYPWSDARNNLVSPLDWDFAVTNLLNQPFGAVFLHAVSAAIDRLRLPGR